MQFENWPELSYMFGEENGIEDFEEIELTSSDLQELSICVDLDFEGFSFLETAGGTAVQVPSSVNLGDDGYQNVDLTNRRIIGFQVTIADVRTPGLELYRNIRSICPILDQLDPANDCLSTEFDLTELQAMVAVIGDGPVSQTFRSDLFSTFYKEQDGYSQCKDVYTLEFQFCEGESILDCTEVADLGWFDFD